MLLLLRPLGFSTDRYSEGLLTAVAVVFADYGTAGAFVILYCTARMRGAPTPIRGGFEPPGAEPVSRYMTSVPLVALIVCVPDDVQLLLNVEPPVKVIVSAISWVHW